LRYFTKTGAKSRVCGCNFQVLENAPRPSKSNCDPTVGQNFPIRKRELAKPAESGANRNLEEVKNSITNDSLGGYVSNCVSKSEADKAPFKNDRATAPRAMKLEFH
jgi:hypothetical protein